MRLSVKLFIVIGLLFTGISGLHAAQTFLDTTFSGTGYTTTDFDPSSQDDAWGITVNDEKIVVVGYSQNDIAVARYNHDGSLDTTFNTSGKVTTDVQAPDGYGDFYELAYGAAIQPDGKTVVVGRTSASAFAVRYDTNGGLDATFNGGKVILPTTLSNDTFSEARSVVLQPDGKIVLTGYGRLNNSDGIMLARLNENGSYDTGFGTNGIVVSVPPVAFTNLEISAVSLQPDGKIVAAGTIWRDYSETFFTARFLLNGLPDTSFGTNGFWIGDPNVLYGHAYDVAIDREDRLILGGVSGGMPMLARLSAQGVLDTTFGVNGFSTVDYAAGYVGSIALDPAGNILFASQSSYENVGAVAMRFSPDGTLDTTFGVNGRIETHFNAYLDVNDVAVDADGKVLTAGFIQQGEDPNNTQFLVMRYLNPQPEASVQNLLVNSDFEASALTPWVRTGAKGNKRTCNMTFVQNGSCGFRITEGSLSQKVNGNAVAVGDTLWVDLWVKGQNIADTASVKMIVTYRDGQKGRVARFFQAGTYEYTQYQTDVFTVAGDVKKIKVQVSYPGGGKLYVDDIQLLRQSSQPVTTDMWLPLPPAQN